MREDWQVNKLNPDLLIAYLQLPRRAVFIDRKRNEAVARGVSLRFQQHPSLKKLHSFRPYLQRNNADEALVRRWIMKALDSHYDTMWLPVAANMS